MPSEVADAAEMVEVGSGDQEFQHPSSVALRRLIQEVTVEEAPSPHAYNRTYNRHNR